MITETTSLKELAALVSEALEREGIVATLSGGSAVSIYTENRYVSKDLDLVTVASVDDLKKALEPLGFEHTGNPRLAVFEHPNTNRYLEFPPAPLGFGGMLVGGGGSNSRPSHCERPIKVNFDTDSRVLALL